MSSSCQSGGQVSTTSITTTRQGATIIQKVSPPPNFGSQISTIISKVTDSKPTQSKVSASGSATKTNVSSIPKPGPSPTNSSTSGDLPSKIRNLNYTPTKPYSEVMDPTDSPSNTSVTSQKSADAPVQSSRSSRPLQTTVTVTSIPGDVKTLHEESSMTSSKSSSASTKTSNCSSSTKTSSSSSTVYYSKGSKSEIVLHEQRPPVVGAPSKAKLLERNRTNDEAEDDEEEESEYSCSQG